MAYKKLIKVSNICQLLDKSKYPATQTINGVTFTNNGDGSIIVNGTATGQYYSGYNINVNLDSVISGHKYAILGADANLTIAILGVYQGGYNFLYSNKIYTFPNNEYTSVSYQIHVVAGVSVSNIIVKPQVFDLTEMYGAGHEPTSVEEFRQDFPEEMYDYSPYCWLTSYKRVFMTGGGNYLTSYQRNLTCKTKNLFQWLGTPLQDSDYVNAVLIETLRNGIILQGNYSDISKQNSYNNGWFRPGSYYGTIANKVNLTAGDTVTISADYLLIDGPYNNTNIGIYLYGAANSTAFVSVSKGELKRVSATYTVTVTGEYYPVFTLNSSKVQITNIQIEKGNTATDYVPYGHL